MKCEARVQPDAWADARPCLRNATQFRQDHPICGSHARQYDRWEKQGRDPRNLSWYWWKWYDDVKPTPGMEL